MWFTENPWPPMLIAGLCSLVCFGLWNSDRRNLHFFLAIGFILLAGVLFAVERAVVTDGERLQVQVAQFCDQFRKRDPATLAHFSETAPEFRQLCQKAINLVEIGNDLRLTDFSTTFSNEKSRAAVTFRANATISAMGFSGHHPLRCILTFQREAGAWKIVDVQRLDPIKGDKMDIMEAR